MAANERTGCMRKKPGKANQGFTEIDGIGAASEDGWIASGESRVYDAAANEGQGDTISFQDRVRIRKSAAGECMATVTLEAELKPFVFGYYPPHSLDVIFVLDVTFSMMSGGSHKMALAKRALIQTINMLWQSNRDTKVTIVPFARDAIVPNPDKGFAYDYIGTLFTWRRAPAIIGQLLGYRNSSYVVTYDIAQYMAQSVPYQANTALSLYNEYRYYKIGYDDIYGPDGSPRPDTTLQDYLQTTYAADPSKYDGNVIQQVASGAPLSPEQLPYSMNDTGYEHNTILDNMIWAIPYGEDTNAEAGLKAAHALLKTPGFAQSDDQLRRAVVLVTDGQTNRSISTDHPTAYATPGSISDDFLPDEPGDPWKYFLYLEQTQSMLLPELANRSANDAELLLAMRRAYEAAERIKAKGDGNATLFVLGIDIQAQMPGPYTREDVLSNMRTIASTGAFLGEAGEDGSSNPIIEALEKLVQNLLMLVGGVHATISDKINTDCFSYVPGSIRIEGEQDGLKLKSESAPDITDPDDPAFTHYKKPALLPDVSDDNVISGSEVLVHIFGVPFALPSPDSVTRIRLSFQLQSNGQCSSDNMPTNDVLDELDVSYFMWTEPDHLEADSSALSYGFPRELYFQTPFVSCHSGVAVQVRVGSDPEDISQRYLEIAQCSTAYYRVVVANKTDQPVTLPLLIEANGVHSVQEALNSPNRHILAEDFMLPPGGSRTFEYQYNIGCGAFEDTDYVVLDIGERHLQDTAMTAAFDVMHAVRIRHLDLDTGKPLGPDDSVNRFLCDEVTGSDHEQQISGYKFVRSEPERALSCEQVSEFRLYYRRKRRPCACCCCRCCCCDDDEAPCSMCEEDDSGDD